MSTQNLSIFSSFFWKKIQEIMIFKWESNLISDDYSKSIKNEQKPWVLPFTSLKFWPFFERLLPMRLQKGWFFTSMLILGGKIKILHFFDQIVKTYFYLILTRFFELESKSTTKKKPKKTQKMVKAEHCFYSWKE